MSFCSPLARMLFDAKDDPLLNNLRDDSQIIEPEWYCPIIPMVLVNGAQGIGTGWSTNIPNHDPREIVRNIKRMLQGQSPEPMMPCFKNFKGTIEQVDDQRFIVNGEAGVTESGNVEITELPIRTWTQTYKDGILEPMRDPKDKIPALIEDYKEYHTDTTVKFVVRMNAAKLEKAEEQGIHKVFKLQTAMATSSMVLFDHAGCIKRYTNVLEILREFYTLRLDYYQKRKDSLEGMLSAESLKLDNIARFICEKIDGVVVVENKPKKELIAILKRRGYDSDPVKAWKESTHGQKEELNDSMDSTEEEMDSATDYNYLLGMPLWNLTKERKDALLKDRDEKAEELYQLRRKTKEDLWLDDLSAFITELDSVEEKERIDAKVQVSTTVKGAKGRQRVKKHLLEETEPSPMSRRIEPRIDNAIRSKAEAAARARKRKDVKKEQTDMFGPEDEEDDTKLSLADRLAAKKGINRNDPNLKALSPVEKPTKKAAAPRKPAGPKREKKSPTTMKKGKSPKKIKKKNPWSDSDSDINSMSDMSDGEDYKASASYISPRAPPRRTAAAKAKYNYDTDEEENPSAPSDSDNDPDAPPPKKLSNGAGAKDSEELTSIRSQPSPSPRSTSPRSTSPLRRNYSDASDEEGTTHSTRDDIFSTESSTRPKSPIFSVDDSDEDPWPPKETFSKSEPPKKDPPKKAAPKKSSSDVPKKAAVKRKPIEMSDDDKPKAKKQAVPKKPRAAPKPKKVAKMKESDSEDDIWDSAPKKKSTAAAKKKKVMSDSDDDMEFGEAAPRATARTGAGRARKEVKYNFGADDDEDEDVY